MFEEQNKWLVYLEHKEGKWSSMRKEARARLWTFVNQSKELGFDSGALWLALGNYAIEVGLIKFKFKNEYKV